MKPIEKHFVLDFWEASSCGEVYAQGRNLRAQLASQAHTRYKLEPYILHFARFSEARGKDVLEVGVGMGADHVRLAEARPRSLTGIDLTMRAVKWTHTRLHEYGLSSSLQVADAEHLPFPNECFDLIYSWGVLHHSPDTRAAIRECHRTLRPGGRARIMIYHHPSVVGYLLWLRYALLKGHPTLSFEEIYARFLESPGTKAYTVDQARHLFTAFDSVTFKVQLSFADQLEGEVGRGHHSNVLRMLKPCWPRALIQRFLGRCGLYLLVEATKTAEAEPEAGGRHRDVSRGACPQAQNST